MVILALFLPLLSFMILASVGYKLGNWGSTRLAVSFIGISLIISCLYFYDIGVNGSIVQIKFFPWFSILNWKLTWGFLFDSLTCTMLVVVNSISLLVHIYSSGYMSEDPHLTRFISYLSLFTFFMLCLVTGDNFLQLFLGWEGVGVSSFLLINFWYTRLQANKAAIKAIIVNRFGDFGVILGLLLIFFIFKSFNFGVVFSLCSLLSDYYIPFFNFELQGVSLISFFLFFGAVGKSAQIGLHTWLPDAMEGPTPVSALIHAATMVTAGVFVLIRISFILEYSLGVLWVIVLLGALTCFFAGTIGMFQNDLKRVIAYSTCSQLGYMVFACGLSQYSVAIFHLMNHAFFKALLFLSAGVVIHALFDEQDMRKMGGLHKILPYTFCMFVIGSLALMGFPFSTGFYSKDVILELAYSNYFVEAIFSYWLGALGACCTAYYSSRLLYFTFLAETNVPKQKINYAHDAPMVMGIPLFFLGLGSIFVGFLFKDMFIGLGTNFWGSSLYVYNNEGSYMLLESEFLAPFIKFLPVFLSIFFGLIALYAYEFLNFKLFNLIKLKAVRLIYKFFNKKWFFDLVYYNYVVKNVLYFGYNVSFKLIDRGLLELVGPTGLVRKIVLLFKFLTNIQSGKLFNYILIIMFFVICFLLVAKSLVFSNIYILLLLGCYVYFNVNNFIKIK